MIEIQLDGQKVEVLEGSTVMHAAEKANIYIPYFCYHKKLSIAANCRMCLVDIEKAPVVASIYQLDSLVRRATSLQLTADARQAARVEGVAA